MYYLQHFNTSTKTCEFQLHICKMQPLSYVFTVC